jgi:hypothetical protein
MSAVVIATKLLLLIQIQDLIDCNILIVSLYSLFNKVIYIYGNEEFFTVFDLSKAHMS